MAFRNYSNWRSSLLRERERIRGAMRIAVPAAGESVRDLMRERIPPNATNSTGMPNMFPGYAATGQMKSTIVTGPVREEANGTMRISVGVMRGARAVDYIKAHVHERGATIYPRQAKLLRFTINGTVIYAKRVRIRPKRWASSAWSEATTEIPGILQRHFEAAYRGQR